MNPNVANSYGETPLVRAVELDREVMAQMLLSAGTLPDGGPKDKDSPLCEAARQGRSTITKISVDAGASINFVNDRGKTPAMIIIEKRQILIFKYLDQHKLKQGRLGRERSES